GGVVTVSGGKVTPFCVGLNDPKGIVAVGVQFFATDKDRVVRIDANGKSSVFADTKAFPAAPMFLNDIEADSKGNLYVSDSGDHKGAGGKIFKIDAKKRVTVLADAAKNPAFKGTNGLRRMSEYHLLVLDAYSGDLLRTRISDGETTRLFEGVIKSGDGITNDHWGRTYLTSWGQGKMWVQERPDQEPRLYAEGFENAADCCLSADGKSILVPDMKGGKLYAVPTVTTNDKPLGVKIERALAEVEWEGWTAAPEKGPLAEHRPLVLTHANDGSGRTFVATQQGRVHSVKDGKAGKLFLDIRDRVRYLNTENEEGMLGLAFPKDYKSSGAFYVYYTPKRDKGATQYNRVSRFRVSKEDPDRADPASEEILITMEKPFWNHDGGTLAFGPDGMLYVAVGDGGLANDPYGNAQNMNTLLGKILRIDVSGEKGYAVPKDNPFAGQEKVKGEIWSYGWRNVWRMSFDRETGALWAADVGQNLWEEINVVEKGGNYGWNPRESFHPFGKMGVGTALDKAIDPVWEYHHDLGKSVTGGHVYRGKAVPALAGKYVYADYVTGHVWALDYDAKEKKVRANHRLRQGGFAVLSFGEDEAGELYLLAASPDGKGIYKFAK
ncbi:MAG: PQQ-dependent sugar dehydrogenase, partial [Gemmataceae bacterium]